jgi:hypothetical protein
MHSQIALPLGRARRFAAIGPGVGLGTGRLRAGTRFTRRFDIGLLRQFQSGQRGGTRLRRRIAHRARQHVTEGIAKRRDVVARTRKTGGAALRGASTEHAE